MGDDIKKIKESTQDLRDRDEAYLRRWENDVGAAEQEIQIAQQSIMALALSNLKSVYLLNGGGLIALPTLLNTFDIAAGRGAYIVGTLYFAGLVLAWMANLKGFFAVEQGEERLWKKRERISEELNAAYFPEKHPENESKAKLKETRRLELEALDRSSKHRGQAIASLFGSFAAFVLGSVGMMVVML